MSVSDTSSSLDDLLNLDSGGPTVVKKSAYEKVGSGQNSSKGAIASVTEEMGDKHLLDRFGFVPKSLLRFDRNKEMMEMLGNDSSHMRKPLRGTIGGGFATKLKFSTYNLDAAKFFLDYYMPPKAKVLDPFMGRGTRSLAAGLLDMTYVGFDTCKDTVQLNRDLLADRLGFPELPEGWNLHLGDGVALIPYSGQENVFDGVFTCPPYYSTEEYSGAEGDLSHMSVPEFDAQIGSLFKNLYPLVKPSGKHRPDIHPVVITVGTFRQGLSGLLDMDYLFQKCAYAAGFILHDKVVTENLPPSAGFTFRRNFGTGFVCKAHETTLVFLKRG